MESNENKTHNNNGINSDNAYDYVTESVGNIQPNKENYAYTSNNVTERPTPKTPISTNTPNNNSNEQ